MNTECWVVGDKEYWGTGREEYWYGAYMGREQYLFMMMEGWK